MKKDNAKKSVLVPFERFIIGTSADEKLQTECIVLPIVRPVGVSDTSGKGRLVFQGNFMGELKECGCWPASVHMFNDHKPENCRILFISDYFNGATRLCIDISEREPEKLLNKKCLVYVFSKSYVFGEIRYVHFEDKKDVFAVEHGGTPFIFSSELPSPIIGELVFDAGTNR